MSKQTQVMKKLFLQRITKWNSGQREFICDFILYKRVNSTGDEKWRIQKVVLRFGEEIVKHYKQETFV